MNSDVSRATPTLAFPLVPEMRTSANYRSAIAKLATGALELGNDGFVRHIRIESPKDIDKKRLQRW
jgi:hypothetical protein